MNVLPFRSVVEFTINGDTGFRINGTLGQSLAPAAMTDNEIGFEARSAQFAQDIEHLGAAPAFDVEAPGEGM